MHDKKIKVVQSVRDGVVGEIKIKMDDQVVGEKEVFKYLGLLVTPDGVQAEVQQRILKERKVLGTVRKGLKGRIMSRETKENIVPAGHSP